MKKIIKYLKSPLLIIPFLGSREYLNWMPDRLYLKLAFLGHRRKNLNLRNPVTFIEKLQWLKLNYHNPIQKELVDKYKVREFVCQKIGEDYLIPLLDVYEDIEQINWGNLPDKFVMKCTHGSGSNIVCKDKDNLDIKLAQESLKKWLKRDWYWFGREWPYKDLVPRVICERFLETDNGELPPDYKFYCFNGTPYYCQVIRGRGINETIDFFDMDWQPMPFTGMRNLPNSRKFIKKPEKLLEMIKLSRILSKEFPFVRVDFYYVDNKVYFGEMTFYPTSGFGEFNPFEWNEKLGDLLELTSTITRNKPEEK